jgi:hypothetical protein
VPLRAESFTSPLFQGATHDRHAEDSTDSADAPIARLLARDV